MLNPFFNKEYVKKWFKKLPRKDKITISDYIESSFPIMYYLFVVKDKKLQDIYSNLFRNALVIREELTVYRAVNINSTDELIKDMQYPFSVSFELSRTEPFRNKKCCTIELILPEYTKVLFNRGINRDDEELIVEPGIINVISKQNDTVKARFIPKGLDFSKEVKLPEKTIEYALDEINSRCYDFRLEVYNRSITRKKYTELIQKNQVRYARESCYENTTKFDSISDEYYGLITQQPKRKSREVYMVGKADKKYIIVGLI